jgi:glycosyltransferase involved in cell wall biosynthesis
MRIGLMTSVKGWRGSAASYAKIALGLIQRGHVARLIVTSQRLAARYEEEGLPVTLIPARNTGPLEVRALSRVFRALKAEAVVVDTPRDLRLSAWSALLQRAKLVYRYNLNYRPARSHLADRLFLWRVSAFVFQSRFIQDDALRQQPWIGRRTRFHIPNGYDTVRFSRVPVEGAAFRRRWDIPANALTVVTTAKLERNKGHEIAIEALSQLHRHGLELIYVICGDGSREAVLRALASRLGLPVRFTGLLDVGSLIAALSGADVMLHPSVQEIFPNSVGEAMSCACAVVAADAGGTGELLGRDGETGALVRPGDPEGMAEVVGGLLRDPHKRAKIGAAARQRIELEFSLERMISGYEAALQQVAGARE